jgi:glucan phosphoethanolaminetransferase (alkaline phosphatase superfamily)
MGEQKEISREKILEGYKSNLARVMEFVDMLGEELNGKTIVTADHGELLGENDLYGHPGHSNLEILRKVPWHEISSK